MLWLILLGAAYVGLKHVDSEPRERLTRMKNPSIARARLPTLVHDDVQEKSFAANQLQNTVRLPFGSNPDTKYVNSQQFIDYPQYRTRYVQEQHRMRVKNQDWRLDVNTNSPLNNFLQAHMAEDYPNLIGSDNSSRSTPFPKIDKRR